MNLTETVPAPPTQEVIDLDLRDLLAGLLLRWKLILLFALAAALLGACLPLLKTASYAGQPSEEAIALAREKVSEDDALEAESLFARYQGDKAVQQDTADYYAALTSPSLDEAGVLGLRRACLVSSSLLDLPYLVTASFMTGSDLASLRAVAPDGEIAMRSEDRVRLTCDGTDSPRLFTLSVYGLDEAQCKEIMRLADAALQRTFRSLQASDPGLTVSAAESEQDGNVSAYYSLLRKRCVDRMTRTSEDLADLAERVNTLSADQRAYYDLLKTRCDLQVAPSSKPSVLRSAVLAALLGAMLAVIVVSFRYLFDGTVKTAADLDYSFRIPVLCSVFFPGKKNLFGPVCARLCGADSVDPAEKVELLATDLDILLNKSGKRSLYLFCREQDAAARDLAEKVKSRLLSLRPETAVSVGNPLASAAEMQKAGTAELGLVFAELKHSKRKDLRRWRQLCCRYDLPLAGAVSVLRCWI